MEVIAALDIGTTGTKAALVDSQGLIITNASAGYNTHTGNGWMEQNPADWWEAAVTSLAELNVQAPSSPVAVVLSGQMQDLILIDHETHLGHALLYSDMRAQAEADIVAKTIGEQQLQDLTGNLQDASSLLAKLLWIKKHQADRYAAARTLLTGSHDYVTWRLCGARCTDFTTASTTGLLDLQANTWALDILDALQLRIDWLPELVTAETQVGVVSAYAAQATGLSEGIPVFHGAGDAATATLGAGAGVPGKYYVYLGTSGWLATSWSDDPVDPVTGIFNLRHPKPDWLIQIGPMLTAAGNFEWLKNTFGSLETKAAGLDEAEAYNLINSLVVEARPGSNGVLYLPYLAGERAPIRDPNARGVFFGLDQRTTRGDLYRAVLEGVALSMRMIREALPVSDTSHTSELSIVGGGAKSPVWPQIFADVFNCPVHILDDPDNVGTRGAALLAGMGLGWYDGYFPSSSYFPVQSSFYPDSAAVSKYDGSYTLFCNLYPALKTIFFELSNTFEGDS
jgi:xylulokinase